MTVRAIYESMLKMCVMWLRSSICRFHHLVGYGATYYSYLYAQALSSAIWQQHFANGQITRSSGDYDFKISIQLDLIQT
jgi:Zn-dependent oligopeptidase